MNYFTFFHDKWSMIVDGTSIEDAARKIKAEIADLSLAKTYTEEEYILKDVPAEFHSALSSMAYERGHSAGEYECMLHLRDLVFDLLPAIEAYAKKFRK